MRGTRGSGELRSDVGRTSVGRQSEELLVDAAGVEVLDDPPSEPDELDELDDVEELDDAELEEDELEVEPDDPRLSVL